MSHRLVSPQEYIASRILSYPSLYAYKDKNVAKFAVLDQLLNVNGNGIRDEEELRETLTVKNDFSIDFQRADAFCEKGVFEGYTKMLKFGPDLNSYTKGYLEEEKVLHREVLIWEQCNPLLEPYEFRTPYPNFKENYSTVYITNFIQVTNKEWRQAAIWFYEKCLDFFLSEQSNQYSYAYPHANLYKTENLLETVTKKYEDFYKKDNARFAKDHQINESEFDGDVDEFLKIRWTKEKQRIISFIEKTIKILQYL